MSRPPAAHKPSAQRSAVSNGTRILVGVNGTTALARRYKDIVADLTAELGGDLGQVEQLQVRNVAGLQMHAEQLTASMVRGETVDPEAISRAMNGATRALAALRRTKAHRKPAAPSVSDYLKARGQQ